MIVVTGAAGFIGSAYIWHLNQLGRSDIVVVDELRSDDKWLNLRKRQFYNFVHKDELHAWLKNAKDIEAVVHMGACSTTTENDADYLMANNVQYSIELFNYCTENQIPFVYASSAATYGDGEQGYNDSETDLFPINKYGFSKHCFDRWVLAQNKFPSKWAGLKFFNVYGPQEYHKGKQASVVFHAFPQVSEDGRLKLFKSYKDGIDHGEQARDFVYVKDVVKVIHHCVKEMSSSANGIYNVGTGQARTFADLGRAVFTACDKAPRFDWIAMPEELRNQYQYFTQANMERTVSVCGFSDPFTSLEDGVADYVGQYLAKDDSYL